MPIEAGGGTAEDFNCGGNMATTTKLDIIMAVQKEAGTSKRQAAAIEEAVFENISQQLERGESVNLSGFGKFVVRTKHARQGRNPKTGEPIEVSARSVLSFKASAILRKRVVSLYP